TRVDGPLTAAYKEELAKGEVGQEKQRVALAVMRGLLEVLKQRVEAVLSKDEGRDDTVLEQVTDRLPKLEGRVAVVLDMSGSMASSGERQNHPAALALALTRLLRESISDLQLFQTGGSASFEEDGLSRPQGVADIAQALLEAVQSQPQLVLIITDGYENLRQGDSAWMVEGLRRLGYGMPIYQVVPLFAGAEKLELRRLDEDIPLIPIVHEEHVSELLGRVLLTTVGEQIAVEELQQLQRLLTKR
ncbi:MAG: hypothetical protein J2P37_28005, partial [Ktedonobacteraceae bacterium]|nr:hypothetical protein [Ktedonobacteraceae bacterium]